MKEKYQLPLKLKLSLDEYIADYLKIDIGERTAFLEVLPEDYREYILYKTSNKGE